MSQPAAQANRLMYLISSGERLLNYFKNWPQYVSSSSERGAQISSIHEFSLFYRRLRDFCDHELFDEMIGRCKAECEAKDNGICTLCLKKPSVKDDLCKECDETIEKSVDEMEKEEELQEFIDMDPGKHKH